MTGGFFSSQPAGPIETPTGFPPPVGVFLLGGFIVRKQTHGSLVGNAGCIAKVAWQLC
jgi:hypothetical protein